MEILSQNAKMKKTSKITGKNTHNFDIPARKTCPKAKDCLSYCYASKGSYCYPNVVNKFERNLALSKKKKFVELMSNEIKYKGVQVLRLHSSGDFYNREYLEKWFKIIEQNKKVKFYAYTKSLHLFKDKNGNNLKIPKNFTVIYSFGGKLDKLINVKKDRHAIVYTGELPDGYAYANDNDHIALARNKKIALKKGIDILETLTKK